MVIKQPHNLRLRREHFLDLRGLDSFHDCLTSRYGGMGLSPCLSSLNDILIWVRGRLMRTSRISDPGSEFTVF